MDKEDLPLEGDPGVEIIGSSPQHQESRGLYSRKDRLGERQRLEQLLTAEEEMVADNPDAGEDYKLRLAELNFQLLNAYASERNPQAGIERGLKAVRILESINRGSEEVDIRIDQTLSRVATSIAQLMDQTGQLGNSIEVLLKGELAGKRLISSGTEDVNVTEEARMSLTRLGFLTAAYITIGEFEKAVATSRDLVQGAEDLLLKPGMDRQAIEDLATAHTWAAIAYVRAARPLDAEASFDRQLALRELLLREVPTDETANFDYAESLASVGAWEISELGKESGVDKQLKALAIARTLAAMNHEQYGGYPESLKPAVIEGLHRAGRHDEANDLSETPGNNGPQA